MVALLGSPTLMSALMSTVSLVAGSCKRAWLAVGGGEAIADGVVAELVSRHRLARVRRQNTLRAGSTCPLAISSRGSGEGPHGMPSGATELDAAVRFCDERATRRRGSRPLTQPCTRRVVQGGHPVGMNTSTRPGSSVLLSGDQRQEQKEQHDGAG
jgi:hypothetical protein